MQTMKSAVQGSGQGFEFLSGMTVPVLVIGQIMIVGMRVHHRVGMCRSVMGMRESMPVQMGMLPYKGIGDHQCGTGNHHDQGCEIFPCKTLIQKHEREESTGKRCHCIIGAGLCRAQNALGPYIQENAESVGNEPQQKSRRRI